MKGYIASSQLRKPGKHTIHEDEREECFFILTFYLIYLKSAANLIVQDLTLIFLGIHESAGEFLHAVNWTAFCEFKGVVFCVVGS